MPAAPDETTTAHMAVMFTEPDEPSSSSTDGGGPDSASGDGSDTDSGSDSGFEQDPRFAAAEAIPSYQHLPCNVSDVLTLHQRRHSLSLVVCSP